MIERMTCLSYNSYMRENTWAEDTRQAGRLAAQLAQVQADLVKFTADILTAGSWKGEGIRSPEHWLQVYTGLSPAQCLGIVRIAERADELPTTVEKMVEGRITVDQAAPIAQRVPAWAEARAASFAEYATVNQVQRVTRKYRFERDPEPYEEPVPKPTPESIRPSLGIQRWGGKFRLKFEASPEEGALLDHALREAKGALFNAGDAEATLADALLEIASRSLASVESVSRREHYKVLIHLNTDGRAWVQKDEALPGHVKEYFTCDGVLKPVWETEGVPVSVGRSQRIVPERTRKLIEDRDGGCRYPGCSTTAFLENHHLIHWSNGGVTDFDSLISLCPSHHKQHHAGIFTIEGDPGLDKELRFYNRHGRRIARYVPEEPPPPPDRPPPIREGIRGESYDSLSVEFGQPPEPVASYPSVLSRRRGGTDVPNGRELAKL